MLSCLEKKWKRKLRKRGHRRRKERLQRRLKKQSQKGRDLRKKRKRSQGPGSQPRIVESVNMQEVVDSLRNQAVLARRIFDKGIITLPGMDSLHDMVEI